MSGTSVGRFAILPIACLAIFPLGIAPAQALQVDDDPNIYKINSKWAPCLVKNKGAYLQTERANIYIDPEKCPKPTRRPPTNSSVSTVDKPTSKTFVIPKRQAKCFFDRLDKALRKAGAQTENLTVDITGC